MKHILFLLLLSSTTFANVSIIIAHNNSISNVTEEELSNLFLKKTHTIRGIKVTPIDSTNKKLYDEFYKKVANKTPIQVREYWINQIYTGKEQPPKKLNNSEIKKKISQKAKIITYASSPLNGKLILTIK